LVIDIKNHVASPCLTGVTVKNPYVLKPRAPDYVTQGKAS